MRVIIIDDHQSFRDAFKLALTKMASITVVGETDSAVDAFALIERSQPDLVLLDLTLKDSDGIALAHQLRRRCSTVPILVLTMHNRGLLVREALEAGVRGYALKHQPLAELIEVMRVCARGDQYLSPQLEPVAPAGADYSSSAHTPTFLERLSTRERQVAAHVIGGSSSQTIADSLNISLKTVETHRAHINRKLGIHSPAELIRLAAIKGFFPESQSPALPREAAE